MMRVPLGILGVVFVIAPNGAIAQTATPTSTGTYLRQASDRYQKTIDVYTDADAAGNHFASRGEFDSSNGIIQVPIMDEISPNAPCFSGITCITATFNGNGSNWGGWYFMNGVLGATDRQPSQNWGTIPNAGYDLTGASTLQFWAKGAVGGERIQFFAFGVGFEPIFGTQVSPFPDSARRATSGLITLSTAWTQYQISISGLDMHYVLGGFGWVAAAQDQSNSFQPITFYLDNIQYVKERPNDPRFIVSYETVKSANAFDFVERNSAFVYDQAVALIALLADGDVGHARTIADSLLYAQANDRFFTDGRLRNAYQGGDLALPPGWVPNGKLDTVRMSGWYDASRATWFEDETEVSTTTGNVAWAMLAILSFYETTHESKYLTSLEQLGNWVIANTWDNRGNGGFTGGYDGWENGAVAGGGSSCASGIFVNGQCKRLYKATEHNIDLYAVFSRLQAIENTPQWGLAANHAKNLFLSMWDPIEGKFWTGTGEDGVTLSTGVVPVDIQAWAIQALGSEAGPYLQALNYVETHHKTALGYGFKQDGGNACGDSTWFEGTSQVAVSNLLAGNHARWQSILDGVHSAQLISGGVLATDGQCLSTGFTLNSGDPWQYFPRAHLGATAWLRLAEIGVNPFASLSPGTALTLISPANGSSGASLKPILSWQATAAGSSYDVYFGASSTPPFAANTTLTTYAPATLVSNTTYYWQVIARGSGGNVSSPVFSFSTFNSSCSFAPIPLAASIGYAGGVGSMNVVAGTGCAWTATSNAAWLTVTSASGSGNGTISFTATANAGTARTASVSFANSVVEVMQGGSPASPFFNDVPSSDPYFDYVSLMFSDGITAGCSTSPPLYCPTTPVTRAQMAVFIVAALDRALGTPLTYTQVPYFQDVPATSIYFPFVQRIKDLGITAGCSASPSLFCPDTSISQGQMAVFMIVGWMLANNLATFSYTATPYFTDVASGDPFFKFVQKMRDLGFWTGCSATLYCESNAVTRGQMAPMIMRSMLGAP